MSDKLKQYDHINPLNDSLFKNLFGNDKYKSSTLAFLNTILNQAINITVKDVTFENTELTSRGFKDKTPRLDVLVKTDDDEPIDIEVQIKKVESYRKRACVYASYLYSKILPKGSSYNDARKAIVISILDYTDFENKDKYMHVYEVLEKDTHEVLDEATPIEIFIEIPKLVKQIKRENKKITELSKLERLLLFISSKIDYNKRQELIKIDDDLNVVYINMETFFENENLAGSYMRFEEEREIWKKEIEELRKANIKSEAKGRAEGIAENSRSTALKLFNLKLPIEQILQVTNLSKADFENLLQEKGLKS